MSRTIRVEASKIKGFPKEFLCEDIAAVRKQYPKIDDVTFNKLIAFDPTFNKDRDSVGTYGKWILNGFNKGNITDKDFGHLKDVLTRFDDNKKNLKQKDIGLYKTVNDLDAMLNDEDSYKELSHRQEVRQRQNARKNADLGEEADIVYEDGDWEVWVPKTYAASCKLGQGASWCTASTESDYYYKYYKNQYGGDYYININKHDPDDKYQFHFQSNQFMDKDDSAISLFDFLGKNEGLKNFYAPIISETMGIDITQPTQMITLSWGDFGMYYKHYGQNSRDSLSTDFVEDCVSAAYEYDDEGLRNEIFHWTFDTPYEQQYIIDAVENNEDKINNKHMHYTADEIVAILSDDMETEDSDIVKDAVGRAYESGLEQGIYKEVIDDFTDAVKNATPYRGNAYDVVEANGDGLMLEIKTDELLKWVESDADEIDDAAWQMYMNNFYFSEPRYGWNGFDDDEFVAVLSDELDY